MKQFSIILILVSCVLGIISHMINFIGIYVGELDSTLPFLSVYTRFGELTLIIGLAGLYVTYRNNYILKTLLMGTILAGFIHFLIIEYGFIPSIGVISALLLLIKFAIFMLFIMQFRDVEMDALRIKGFALISIIGVYWLAFFVISILSIFIFQTTPTLSDLILPIFYIIYQIGLWIFFIELYREIFHYNNQHYIQL